jgi:hypothetical protein
MGTIKDVINYRFLSCVSLYFTLECWRHWCRTVYIHQLLLDRRHSLQSNKAKGRIERNNCPSLSLGFKNCIVVSLVSIINQSSNRKLNSDIMIHTLLLSRSSWFGAFSCPSSQCLHSLSFIISVNFSSVVSASCVMNSRFWCKKDVLVDIKRLKNYVCVIQWTKSEPFFFSKT